MNRIFLAMGLLCAMASAAGAADFHVAPHGNDDNPGTAERPFATIMKARDAGRATGGGNTVLLAPGNYFNDAAIVLDERDSGLTIKGEQPGATAEIYGGVPVTGWEKWKENIWRAPVPKDVRFFNLIVDEQPATMAQWPKAGSGYGGGFTPKGNGAILVPREFRSCDFSDAQVRTWVGNNWFTEVRESLAATPDAEGVLKVDQGAAVAFSMNNRFYVRGVLEFLTEPGEWCLKHNDGFVYYWPKTGTPADHLIVRAATQRIFDVEGRQPQTPAKAITLENLSLIGSDFCQRWYLWKNGLDATTPEPLQQGMVFGNSVEGLNVSGCRLLAAGHSGVWLNYFAKNCVVENCLIMHTGFAGVYANGFAPGQGPFQSAAESYVNKGHRIENNFIFDVCRLAGGGGGIIFYQSGDNLATRNEISQSPRYAVSTKGERWGVLPKKLYGHDVTFANHLDFIHSRNLKIVGNDIHNVCRDSYDYGAIESWSSGRDNLWGYNALHDIDSAVDWGNGLMVLDADDASHYLTMRGNIVYHCQGGAGGRNQVVFVKSLGQVVENNLIVDNQMMAIWASFYCEPAGDTVVRHNVIANDPQRKHYSIDGPRLDPAANISGVAGKEYPAGTVNIKEWDYNTLLPETGVVGNPLAAKGFDVHSCFGDPRILRAKPDWDITFRDYSLAPDSPAFKEGFKPIDTSVIGLREDFPFDTAAATRRLATDKIQAEDYQRMHELHTIAAYGIGGMSAGSWAKYANIDFGAGVNQAVFQLDADSEAANTAQPFIHHYGDTAVEATPFKGDGRVETITQWEISKPYTKAGKTGSELFDEVFEPETDPKAGVWKFVSMPSATGIVNFAQAQGDTDIADSCAYARASIYAPSGRTNATMTIVTGGGAKVWLNGNLILSANKPGTYSEIRKGIIKQGWNTILVKVNQNAAARSTKEEGAGNFSFKFGTVASACGAIAYLPGLPTEERAMRPIIELHLDAPIGPSIGALPAGQTTCPVKSATGIHNLFLVFPNNAIKSVDWFKFEK